MKLRAVPINGQCTSLEGAGKSLDSNDISADHNHHQSRIKIKGIYLFTQTKLSFKDRVTAKE